MPMVAFESVFFSVAVVIILSMCGFVLFCRKVISEDGIKELANLLVSLFLPCFIFYHTVSIRWEKDILGWIWFVVLGFIIFILALLCGFLMAYLLRIEDKKLFASLIAFQNCGYMPLIMIDAIFSESKKSMLFLWVFLFIISFNLMVWSVGVWLVSGKRMGKRRFLEKVINPPFVSTVLAIVVSLLGIRVPDFVMQLFDILGRPVLPLSMLIMGAMLAISFSKQHPFPREDMYVVGWAVVGKMIVFPMIGLGFVLLLKKIIQLNFWVSWFSFLQFTLPSAVSLVIISTVYGGKSKLISWVLLLSHLVGILSVPTAMYVFEKLCG